MEVLDSILKSRPDRAVYELHKAAWVAYDLCCQQGTRHCWQIGIGPICLVLAALHKLSMGEDVQLTKVFVLPIEPSLFNWTNGYTPNGYWYRASLLNRPDLPPWMSYHYSKRHRKGFIYGVPAVDATVVKVEVVGLNREDFETRTAIIPVNVVEKPDPAKYEIQLKIDNLNLEDMFDPHRLFNLLQIFTTVLWPESADNLYLTNLVSAVKMGARLPLLPYEGEGVIVHVGSSSGFSETLEQLEQEVLPLRKLTSCPRDFKRSSVDRHFRPNGFIIDWCSFKLVRTEAKKPLDHSQYHEPSQSYGSMSLMDLTRREEIPTRDYSMETITTLIVPAVSLLALIVFLNVILCMQREEIEKTYKDEIVCEDKEQRPQCTLREDSPRLTSDTDDACRPSPPPYSGTQRLEFNS